MVSEGPSNPLLHAMFQGCQSLHGGEDTFNNGAFHFVVTDENFMTSDHRSTSTKVSERSAEQPACKKEHVTLNPRNAVQDQHSTRKKVSERSAEQHACKKELVTLKSFNAVQRNERKIRVQQVTLTPKVYTYYERFLNNLTAHATENQQRMLEDVFQRYAGGNVAYYGRRGVCRVRLILCPKRSTLCCKRLRNAETFILPPCHPASVVAHSRAMLNSLHLRAGYRTSPHHPITSTK